MRGRSKKDTIVLGAVELLDDEAAAIGGILHAGKIMGGGVAGDIHPFGGLCRECDDADAGFGDGFADF